MGKARTQVFRLSTFGHRFAIGAINYDYILCDVIDADESMPGVLTYLTIEESRTLRKMLKKAEKEASKHERW